MRKYLWMLPVVMLMVVLVGCHSNVTEVAEKVALKIVELQAQLTAGTTTSINAEVKTEAGVLIDKVEFKVGDKVLDGTLIPDGTRAYCEWSTTGFAPGDHEIEVIAKDAAGKVLGRSVKSTVTITAPDLAKDPTVAITAPADGAQVSGEFDVEVEATPQGEATITKVEVTFAGTTKTVAGGKVTFDSSKAANGDQTITAVATDSSGRTGSATSTVTVANLPPTVEITEPAADGAEVIGNFDVTVAATPHAAGVTITKVDVTFGGTKKTVNAAAGTVTFDSTTVANGAQTITAVATDSNGKTGQATRNVTVNNPTPFTVGVENVTVASGADVIVPIVMSDTTGVAGFGMTINYDQTKLELVGGDAAIVKGAAVPAGALLLPNTATPGVIRVAVAGTTNFNAAEQEILTIAFKAIGAAGPTAVDIDDSAEAPTRFEFVNAMATPIDPQPTAVDGTVTIQ
jgi:hypothetical protein